MWSMEMSAGLSRRSVETMKVGWPLALERGSLLGIRVRRDPSQLQHTLLTLCGKG